MEDFRDIKLSRREFVVAGAASVTAAAVPAGAATPPAPGASVATGALKPVAANVSFVVNGQPRALALDTRTTLLDALREHLHLTGTKKGCDHGQCGACTVLIDGRRVNSCLKLAVTLDGAEITTIEGLGQPGNLHPLQSAFCDHDAFQCGYCTPGQIISAIGCVQEGHAGTPADIREYMSGNLCRCAAYPNIVAAIEQAKPQMAGKG